MRKKIKIIALLFSLFFAVNIQSQASFMAAATEPTQATHTGQTVAGWLWDAQAWMQDRVTDLDKLLELVENNILTKAIRGFNELMTAIQTDISDVLGTIETLVDTPLDIFNSLTAIPGSIVGTFTGLANGDRFKGMFDQVNNIFTSIGEYQTLGKTDFTNLLSPGGGSGFSSGYDLSNRVSGLRSSLASKFLSESEERDKMYKKWDRERKYGKDAIQMQSTQIDIMKEVVENQNRDQEYAMMDRLQENSDRIAAYEQERARTNRLITQGAQRLTDQLW
jgi:hypothetical protein